MCCKPRVKLSQFKQKTKCSSLHGDVTWSNCSRPRPSSRLPDVTGPPPPALQSLSGSPGYYISNEVRASGNISVPSRPGTQDITRGRQGGTGQSTSWVSGLVALNSFLPCVLCRAPLQTINPYPPPWLGLFLTLQTFAPVPPAWVCPGWAGTYSPRGALRYTLIISVHITTSVKC